MSISAISGSCACGTTYENSSSKKKTGDDPIAQAISRLQSTDPTLASKLSDMQKKADAMKKDGASEKDVRSVIKSTIDGLSSTEKAEFQSARPAPPAGGKGGQGGPHGGPPPSGGASNASVTDASSSSFSLSSLLDSSSSMQNDSIMSLLANRASVM